jgi:Arc/MetJ-type ribon-helix-helix transcriptional regulator
MNFMKTMVQARLDEESQAALDRLVRRHGWTTSRVVREGIRLVEEQHALQPRRKLIGVGKYDAGVRDLTTNKKYMEDFGRKSMGRASRKLPRGSAE